jgi:hypothetical protein
MDFLIFNELDFIGVEEGFGAEGDEVLSVEFYALFL